MHDITIDDIVVIVAVNDRAILAGCLLRSPDIAAGRVPVIDIEGAKSMPEAYNRGLDQTDRRLCIFAHQDVYLPRGWLDRAIDALNDLTRRHPDWEVAGPHGVRADGVQLGRIWDVMLDRELGDRLPAPAAVGSFDEMVLILRRPDGYRFDMQLPHFHLYGTDIAQTALTSGRGAYAIDLPVVHNNRPIPTLRGGYARAYWYARRKWWSRLPIATTILPVSRNPLLLWQRHWKMRHNRPRPDHLLADSVDVARAAGYE